MFSVDPNSYLGHSHLSCHRQNGYIHNRVRDFHCGTSLVITTDPSFSRSITQQRPRIAIAIENSKRLSNARRLIMSREETCCVFLRNAIESWFLMYNSIIYKYITASHIQRSNLNFLETCSFTSFIFCHTEDRLAKRFVAHNNKYNVTQKTPLLYLGINMYYCLLFITNTGEFASSQLFLSGHTGSLKDKQSVYDQHNVDWDLLQVTHASIYPPLHNSLLVALACCQSSSWLECFTSLHSESSS